MKVVGIGLSRTGTTTLGTCFRHWGLKHISYDRKMVLRWHAGDMEPLLRCVAQHDSFEDWPWPLVFREIDKEFPNTRFVLTRRSSPDTWFSSYCRHAQGGEPDVREIIFGERRPDDHKTEHVRFYENHLKSVREYFAQRPHDLLEVCWEEGDGWRELSDFLELDCPDVAFPHANRSE